MKPKDFLGNQVGVDPPGLHSATFSAQFRAAMRAARGKAFRLKKLKRACQPS